MIEGDPSAPDGTCPLFPRFTIDDAAGLSYGEVKHLLKEKHSGVRPHCGKKEQLQRIQLFL